MATAAAAPRRWKNDRLFYTGMGVFVALVTFWGFYRSYYLNRWFETPAGMRELNVLLHVHGAVFTAWIALGVVQPALIASRNTRLHRKLGYFGAAVAASMVVLGIVAGIEAMRGGGFIGLGDPRAFFAVPFLALVTFAVIVTLAIRWRNRAETHKRLMLLASTQVIEAAVARIPMATAGAPFSFFIGADLIIAAGVAYDLVSRGRVHKVWIWGGLAVVASQALRLMIANTGPWMAFAEWMRDLPIL
ncbi:MAG TPA: hypothetical protein VGB08_03110 [Allosphingosinicella sp.]